MRKSNTGDIQPASPRGDEWLQSDKRVVGDNLPGGAMLALCRHSR
jgi:hypothetical protein